MPSGAAVICNMDIFIFLFDVLTFSSAYAIIKNGIVYYQMILQEGIVKYG